MPRDGTETRERILDAAQRLILGQSFAGASVEAIVEGAGVTKGAFFHHFSSKTDLAHALVERYAAADAEHLESLMERSERLSGDPLQRVLIFVGLLEESVEDLTERNPGCLFASFVYAQQLVDEETRALIRRAFSRWRDRLGGMLREAMERYSPQRPADPEDLADMLLALYEGGYILTRTMRDPRAVARQTRHFRNYLEDLFGAAAS
ncbi:MAG: TetR/AcrR family transcriptional regulator [Gemmatimonadota bacterium]